MRDFITASRAKHWSKERTSFAKQDALLRDLDKINHEISAACGRGETEILHSRLFVSLDYMYKLQRAILHAGFACTLENTWGGFGHGIRIFWGCVKHERHAELWVDDALPNSPFFRWETK